MAMTKKTVYTTTHAPTQETNAEVSLKVTQLIAQGATDGYLEYVENSGVITRTRHWLDQDAAAAWQTWVTNFAAENNYTFDTFVISDI